MSPLRTLGRTSGEHLHAISKPIVIGRVVTATITLICVLIVYGGWASLALRDVILIVVAPVLAVFLSHVFAATLIQHVELGRRPSKREWVTTVLFETRFLLIAVPPVAILVLLSAAGFSLGEAIRVVVWLEALTLGFWAGLAAHYAGLRGRSLALAVVAGLAVGILVLGLEVFLAPGADAAKEGSAQNRG